MFDIQKDQPGSFQKPFVFFFPVFPEKNAGGIQAGMDMSGTGLFKEFCKKGKLHKRLSTGCSNASFLIKTFVFLINFQDFLHCHRGSPFWGPGIRIVAVKTAHGTALEKHRQTYPRAVNCTKTLYGVDISLFFTFLHGRSGR